jgi:hypothetical protein
LLPASAVAPAAAASALRPLPPLSRELLQEHSNVIPGQARAVRLRLRAAPRS